VRTAAQLLRLILAYACNLPLGVIATWASAIGLAHLTDESLNARIRHARHWLGVLLTQVLAARAGLPRLPALRLRLIDATTVARPGAPGTDWRLHLTFDLAHFRLDAAEITDAHGGEALTRSAPQPGDVVVGDRAYGTRAGVLATMTAGAMALVRLAWSTFPLQHPDGRVFNLMAALGTVAHDATAAWDVRMAPTRRTDPAVPGRLIVQRLPAAIAATARDAVRTQHRKTAKKNASGRRAALHPHTLIAAEYLILFTTVPAALASAAQIVALYRFRWQIELAIKRLKSVLGLAHLTARHDDLCRAVLTAKLLLAVLVDDLCADAEAFSPSARRRRPARASAQRLSALPTGLGTPPRHHPPGALLAALDRRTPRRPRVLL
jgi:hypothetical protein